MTPEQATNECKALMEAWMAALLGRDVAFFERTLDDSWIYTTTRGERLGKQDYIGALALVPPNASIQLLELAAQLHGEIAIVIGRYETCGVLLDGRDIRSSTRFTAVWKRVLGGFRALVHHATDIAEP